MTTVAAEWITGEELYEMADVGRCELVEGRIVEMSPTKPEHGRYEYLLARRIGDFVEERDLGQVMVGEVGIYTRRNPDTVRAADVLFISHERYARATKGSFLDVAPELIVEVLSPNDRWSDVRAKLREYFAIGVNVVLVVETEAQIVAVYRSSTDLDELTSEDVLRIEDVLPGFEFPLQELFQD